MSVLGLKDALKDIPGIDTLTVGYAHNGNQIVAIGDKAIEVGPMASNDEIRLAFLNPFIPTANTKVTMVSPLQGIGQKLSKLKHDTEIDAGKLSSRIDAVATRKDTALAKSNKALDSQEADIGDIESFVADIEKATNQ